MAQYSIGVDFGTLSARAVIVNTENGHVCARSEYVYPHKILSALPDGTPLPPDAAFAHPADYMDGLQQTVAAVMAQSGVPADEVIAIGVDCTACSVLPLGKNGMPLALTPEFEGHAHAYIKLWKHHTASAQAERLQTAAEARSERFLADCGNRISCESFFPKVLETFEADRAVFDAAHAFVEVGEWLTLLLTGKLIASEPTAAFKRFYHPFRGYPSAEFFNSAADGFGDVLKKLRGKMISVGQSVGTLHPRMAEMLGLSENTVVSVPMIDAHTAAAACGGKTGDLICVMGTSGVSLMVSHNDTGMDGVYSSACHAFLPDVYGHEATQSAVGDTLAWFADAMVPPDYVDRAMEAELTVQQYLTKLADELPVGESGLLALDWNGGARTPFMDFSLRGTWVGLTNRTRPEEIYRALLESIAFGVRRIKEIFENHGHTVLRVLCCGGISAKNRLFAKILADVLGREVQVLSVSDACALGSAILGAITAAGSDQVRAVLHAMSSSDAESFFPSFDAQEIYTALYREYIKLGDFMSGYHSVMRNAAKWSVKA